MGVSQLETLMLLRRLRRSYEKNRNEVQGLLLARYPAFVRRNVAPTDVPVFQFHEVSIDSFAPAMEYLAVNRYRTLTADEYLERLVGRKPPSGREVMLTFDDGRSSLFSVAFPALRSHGLRAVAYVIPGRTPEHDADATSHGRVDRLCNWQQIREMHESGVIDVQSHSMYHHSIATSCAVADFSHPRLATSFLESDLSPLGAQVPGEGGYEATDVGLPIHEWGARMGPSPAVIEAPQVLEACRLRVHREGQHEFLARKGWRKELRTTLDQARREYGMPSFETRDEQVRAMLRDLVDSKKEIEARLPGKTVRHYCFPWFRGSVLGAELSFTAGYLTNAWGSLLPGFIDRAATEPRPIARMDPKYLWRLPGKGRRSAWQAVWAK